MTASYLLKADAETMARWKREAKARGLTFADHIRDRLNEKSAGVVRAEVGPAHARVVVETIAPKALPVKTLPVPPSPHPFSPDFKSGKKKP